jgi:hypothetical protein
MWSVRLGFDGGLGGEAENMSLFAPVVRQGSLLSRKSRLGVSSIG